MDKERIDGFCKAFEPGEILIWQIPDTEKERMLFYQENLQDLLNRSICAVFVFFFHYAIEFMRFLQGKGIQIPQDIQIIGFDDNMTGRESNPTLITFHQDAVQRAKTAIECLEAMRDGVECQAEIVRPVKLIKRESTRLL